MTSRCAFEAEIRNRWQRRQHRKLYAAFLLLATALVLSIAREMGWLTW